MHLGPVELAAAFPLLAERGPRPYTFDLGVGDFSYKFTWATDHLPLYSHERALTAAGSLYLQLRRAQRLIKSGTVTRWFRRAR